MNTVNENAESAKRTESLECCEKLLKRAAIVIVGAFGVLLTYKIFEGLFLLGAFLFG